MADGPLYPHTDLSVWLRSCAREEEEAVAGSRSGTIPPWLSGSLVQNGPGRWGWGSQTYHHLFDGRDANCCVT